MTLKVSPRDAAAAVDDGRRNMFALLCSSAETRACEADLVLREILLFSRGTRDSCPTLPYSAFLDADQESIREYERFARPQIAALIAQAQQAH